MCIRNAEGCKLSYTWAFFVLIIQCHTYISVTVLHFIIVCVNIVTMDEEIFTPTLEKASSNCAHSLSLDTECNLSYHGLCVHSLLTVKVASQKQSRNNYYIRLLISPD